ncbi:MAG TPA: hypothetical protein VGJ69_04970, partial [Pyrinomonadaceae bacterium]
LLCRRVKLQILDELALPFFSSFQTLRQPNQTRKRIFFAALGRQVVLQTSIEELKTYIQDKLRPKAKSATSNGNGNGKPHDEGPLRVYLICDKQDYDAIGLLSDHLFDQGFEVTLPLFEGDEAEVREDHKESLLLCDAVVIFYGNSSEGWLRTKLRDLQKIPGYGRTKPMLAQAIYTGPPENPAKQRYRTREALLLRNFGDFTPDAIQPFIEEINKAKR